VQQSSGNLGQAVREAGRAGSNNSAQERHSHSHDESPDADDTGSPTGAANGGSKRGGVKTKRNARQQDQNKQARSAACMTMFGQDPAETAWRHPGNALLRVQAQADV
jgi:hypothetical protein